MKCYISTTLLLTLGITSQVVASPVAPICRVVRGALAFDPRSQPRVTAYCSSLLAIKTRTVANTQVHTTSTTVQQIATAANAVTVTAAPVTSIDTVSQTSTNTETDIAIVTVTYSTGSETITVTSGTTTSTTIVCAPPPTIAGRGAQLEQRAAKLARPAAWNNFANSLLSSACCCLSLTTPTVTGQAKSTATISITQTSTVTSTTTTTPTVLVTITSVAYVTATSILTATYAARYTESSTVTVQATSIVSNNICAATANYGNSVFGFQEPDGYSTGLAFGNLNEIQLISSWNDGYDYLVLIQQAGRIYAVRREPPSGSNSQSYAAGSVIMYVKDGMLGGPVYFGSSDHVAANGYFTPACTLTRYFNAFIAVCYNSAGAPFSPALDQRRGKLLLYTGSKPSGAVGITLNWSDWY